MGRKVAVLVHAPLSVFAGALYFLFVLPRWWELSYITSHSLGTVLRIVCGALVGLAALPVVFTWLRTRKPEYGTPEMALRLLLLSTALHVLGGVLIIGTAISEIWLSLDDAGPWLFGIYGAAAAISILGIAAFYLSFVAELPPPQPRPLKAKERKGRRRRKDEEGEATEEAGEKDEAEQEAAADEAEEQETADEEPAEEQPAEEQPTEVTAEDAEEATTDTEGADEEAAESARGGLRNRRPSGKTGTRRRLRRGVAVED
jgi:hypothetical protein